MNPNDLEQNLQSLRRRTPFSAFTVEFFNGDRVVIDTPDALVVRAGLAVYLDKHGGPTFLDHENVVRIFDQPSE